MHPGLLAHPNQVMLRGSSLESVSYFYFYCTEHIKYVVPNVCDSAQYYQPERVTQFTAVFTTALFFSILQVWLSVTSMRLGVMRRINS